VCDFSRLARFVLRIAFIVLVAASVFVAVPRRAEAATSCSVATSAAAHELCWLDLTGFTGAGSTTFNFTIALPDGSTLTGTIANTSATSVGAPVAVPVYGTGSFGGVALGTEAYLGITGNVAIYPATDTGSPIQISNVVLKDPNGNVVPNVTIAGADAESTDTGDGKTGSLNWATTGTNWAQLQLMPNPAGSITDVCTLSGIGSQTAACVPNTGGAPAAAYILTTTLTNGQSVTMSDVTSAREGFAFAIELATLSAAKSVASREAAGDQFTVQVTRGATVVTSATTTGTGTTAAAIPAVVVPGDAYVIGDVAASGSTTKIANYASTVACTNATTTSTTTLPVANASAQSVTIVPAADDKISCTFSNNAVSLTDTAATPTKTVTAGTTDTDSFTLKNTSGIAGTFQIVQPTIVASNGTSVTPTGYTFGGNTYATLAALQAAITAAGPTAAGGTISIGATYIVPGSSGTSATVTLPATLTSGTGTAPQATAQDVDTIAPTATLQIAKTGTTASSPGGLIAYSILVSNAGPSPANGATFSDPMPNGVVVSGTPTCGTPTGGAACGSVSVGSTAPQTVTSTIATLPVGGSVTFSVNATAASAASYTNTASVSPPAGTAGGPVSSSLTTVVTQTNGLQKTVQDLTAGTAASTSNTGKPGDTLRYALTFTNTTGASISNVAFADTVQPHTTFVAATCPASTTSLPAGIACATGSPAVGSTGTSVTFTFSGTLAAGATVTAQLDVKIQ
jgi:uncharacterized repeat protein (TIGR01451 family)